MSGRNWYKIPKRRHGFNYLAIQSQCDTKAHQESIAWIKTMITGKQHFDAFIISCESDIKLNGHLTNGQVRVLEEIKDELISQAIKNLQGVKK